jgi:hypothetical protein
MSVECLVKIKPGAFIGQDMSQSEWPHLNGRKEVDPETVFLAEKKGRYWNCRCYGCGFLQGKHYEGDYDGDAYGNGSIYVHDMDGVELLTPMHAKGVLKL